MSQKKASSLQLSVNRSRALTVPPTHSPPVYRFGVENRNPFRPAAFDKRNIRPLEQLIDVRAVLRCERNADAEPTRLLTTEHNRLVDCVQQPVRQQSRSLLRLLDITSARWQIRRRRSCPASSSQVQDRSRSATVRNSASPSGCRACRSPPELSRSNIRRANDCRAGSAVQRFAHLLLEFDTVEQAGDVM